MAFDGPQAAATALRFLRSKRLMPTELRTWALDLLPVELRERSFFSAGVTQAEFLDQARESVAAMVAGGADRATMRVRLRQLLAQMGYQPGSDEAGSLTDLSSDSRLNLILDTNTAQARGYGTHVHKQQPGVLRVRPAQELVRAGGSPMQPRPWGDMWDNARSLAGTEGTTAASTGRLVARKDHPIWTLSVEAGGFNRFGTPYPPFDFNSGMRLRDVSREDAIALGVIEPDEDVQPDSRALNDGLQATPKVGSAQLRQALERSGLGKFNGDTFVPTP